MTALASPARAPGSAPTRPAGGGDAAVLRCPGVPLLLAGTLLGRLPSAMAPTLVLLAQIRTGAPMATAGALAGAQTLASALGQVLLARQADRVGHRPVVLAATAATTAVYAALAAAPDRPLTWVLVVASELCPPTQSCLRSRWPSLVPHQLLPSANMLDAATNELLYIAAPLLAAGTVYGLGPGVGFLLAAGTGAAGTAAIARRLTPHPAGGPVGEATDPTGGRGRVRPWRCRGMARLLGVHAAVGGVLGAVPIAGVLLAARAHQPAAAGLLSAGASAGSVLAGLAFGVRSWTGTPARRLAAASASWPPAGFR